MNAINPTFANVSKTAKELKAMSMAQRLAFAADNEGMTPKGVFFMLQNALHLQNGNPYRIPTTKVTAEDIAKADRIMRKASADLQERVKAHNAKVNPEPEFKDEPKAVKSSKTPRKAGHVERFKLYGASVTSVIRWMGVQGWSFDKAYKALCCKGCDNLADVTIRIQLAAGRKGQRGPAAELHKAQVAELKKLAK